MMKEKMGMTKRSAVLGAVVLALTACGTPGMPGSAQSTSMPVAASSATGYGVVQSIDVVQQQGNGIGLGTVAGAVVGGVLGNQIGGGKGRTAATVAGAAGGAYAGNKIEQNRRSGEAMYRVTVRMDNGALQTFDMASATDLRVGERVRLANGAIVERYR